MVISFGGRNEEKRKQKRNKNERDCIALDKLLWNGELASTLQWPETFAWSMCAALAHINVRQIEMRMSINWMGKMRKRNQTRAYLAWGPKC